MSSIQSEVVCYRCHLIQSGLRSGGSKEYVIPQGFLFDYVTCANYTAEIAAWLCFSFATQTLAAFMFAAGGTCQMVPWAIQKHNRLRKVGLPTLAMHSLRFASTHSSELPFRSHRAGNLNNCSAAITLLMCSHLVLVLFTAMHFRTRAAG